VTSALLGPVEQVKTSDLEFYPGNARRGDVDAIAESLKVHGQFQPIIVQASTNFVLVGNHTLKAAQKLRWAKVAVIRIDVDDIQAKKIVLVANRTADLGTYDLDALSALLQDLDDLAGSGYSDADLVGLIDDGNDDDPDLDDEDVVSKSSKLGVIIYCSTEREQVELLELLLEEGRDARAL
jgi:ParB-like chromosome segregation protein Spo0J